VWQQLFDSLKTENFMIVAVAEESGGAEAARPWIEQAAPGYLCLTDQDHRLSSLFGMVNVPQSVWIDQSGRIVRGPETAGSTDHFRHMDRATGILAPELQAARTAARLRYMAAVRDWVLTGRHGLNEEAARAALPRITPDIALAHAHFRLGIWLHRHGKTAEAATQLAAASRLHPDSWNIWRQAAAFDANASGEAFWARVAALGDRPYYPPPNLPDLPGSKQPLAAWPSDGSSRLRANLQRLP
jgi:hypothetical protein